jgi:DNA primase
METDASLQMRSAGGGSTVNRGNMASGHLHFQRRSQRSTLPVRASRTSIFSWIFTMSRNRPRENATLCFQLEQDPLGTVARYYASCLVKHPHVASFLTDNLLAPQQQSSQWSQLGIGFCDRTLPNQLPTHKAKRGRELREQLTAAGILKDTGYELLRGCLTVPLCDVDGKLVGMYGYRIATHKNGRAPRDAPPEITLGQGIFPAASITRYSEMILANDVLSALAFHAAGHQNTIALLNTPLSAESLRGVKRLLLAYPNTDEGNAEIARLVHNELPEGISPHRIKFPLDQDARKFVVEYRNVTDALGQRIRAASWIEPPANEERSKEAPSEQTPAQEETSKTEPGKTQPEPNPQATAKEKTPAASPVPVFAEELPTTVTDTEVTIEIENRHWRIRGLDRNSIGGVMKVNLLVTYNERFHVDTLDLYHSRSRKAFLLEAAHEVGAAEAMLRTDLGRVLLKLEQLQTQQAQQAKQAEPEVTLSESQREEAMALLTAPDMIDRILADFETCGVVGETLAKLTGYLAATSRQLPKPLGLVLQSSSAAGKSSLLDAVLDFMPDERVYSCSSMTGQSLYYMQQENLKHKVLAISEEEGVRDAAYALKILQSEGRLSIATTAREAGSGRTTIERYEVEGPVALLLTTTASDVDAELLNRCLVVSVDEQWQQTEAIQQRQRQRETLQGLVARQRAQELRELHQNAQRLLEPVEIINPLAEQLQFTNARVRNRRDHAKYLSLIRAVTFLFQHQRPRQQANVSGRTVEYIEVTRDDITLGNSIANAIFGQSMDELPQQSRRLLGEISWFVDHLAEQQQIAQAEVRFTRRQLREQFGWGATQLWHHLHQLCSWEYVVAQGGGRGKLIEYQLLGDSGPAMAQPGAICGLIEPVDPAKLAEIGVGKSG